MKRLGVLFVVVAFVATVLGSAVPRLPYDYPSVSGFDGGEVVSSVLFVAAVFLASYGVYRLVTNALTRSSLSKRRAYNLRNVLRLAFGVATVIAVLGVLTDRWVGVLFSLGIVGFAVTFALQQPLFSLIGWVYVTIKKPYQVGDRVKIGDAKGDVIEVDFLVTTLWEINGDLVSSNQPSGRLVTLPNSTVLSTQVFNYSWSEFPYVWNEISVQVAYETDLGFARRELADVADEHLGDEMEARIDRYREVLDETPVELEVQDRPSVNITQGESWVELRLRYLVHPKNGQRTKNRLYEKALERFNENPDRVGFPVGRNR